MKKSITLLLLLCYGIAQGQQKFLLQAYKSNEAIISLDFNPDGKKIAIGGQDNSITIYDITQKRVVQKMEAHTDDVVAVKYSPNGRYIASGSVDKSMIIWNALTGDMIHQINHHQDYVRDVAFSPDSRWVAAASWDGTFSVWNVATAAKVILISPEIDNITTVMFNHDGTELLIGSGDHSVRVWNTDTWKEKYLLVGHTDEVWDAKFSKNSLLVTGGAWDNKARVWDVKNKNMIYTFDKHTSDVWSVAISPINQMMVSGGGDRKIYCWDLTTGDLIADIAEDAFEAEVEEVTFSPDGKLIAAVSRDGYLRIFDSPTMQNKLNVYIENNLKKWERRGEFEKLEAYQQRLTTRDNEKAKLLSKYSNNMGNYIVQFENWQQLELANYDPDKEFFKVKSIVFGDLTVAVSNEDAPKFKENFGKAVFDSPKVIVTSEGVKLKELKVKLSQSERNTKQYILTNTNENI